MDVLKWIKAQVEIPSHHWQLIEGRRHIITSTGAVDDIFDIV